MGTTSFDRAPVILFIEDDTKDAQLCMTILAPHEAKSLYRTVFVRDGPEALGYLRGAAHLPVVVVLDLHLPKCHGLDVVNELRGSRFSQIPIVILSASSAPKDISACYKAGVNAYVVKPTNFREFESAVLAIASFWTINRIAR